MDIRFISSLLLVIDRGSFAAAAREQKLTPAAVSQRVSALEAELQAKLLVRSGRRVKPTPHCHKIIPNLRVLMRARAELLAASRDETLQGSLRIGAISTALSDYAPRIVKSLKQRAPRVDLELIPGTSKELFARFEAGELDAVILIRPPFDLPKTMRLECIAQQQIGLLRGHDKGQFPYVVYSRDAWGGELCWEAVLKRDPSPKILCEMDAVEVIAQMVQDGLGQAVLPEWQGLHSNFEQTEFTALPGPAREIGLLTWQRDNTSAPLKIVRACLLD